MTTRDVEEALTDALTRADNLWQAPPGLAERVLARSRADGIRRLGVSDPHRPSQWRWPVRVLSAAVVVGVLLAVGLTLTLPGRTGRDPAPASSGAVAISTPPLTPPGRVSAADLASYRWSTLPAAPITVRDGAAATWTGREMLVWGGFTSGSKVFGDGAAYNPSTRTWRMLPLSPLSARTGTASVWTGTKWFLWGGATSGAKTVTDEGATYDPATDTWAPLPSPNLPSATQATAVWTGTTVLLMTVGAAGDGDTLSTSSWDPATGRWIRFADLPVAPDTSLYDVSMTAVASGPATFLWLMQAGSAGPVRSGAIGWSAHAYRLSAGQRTWQEIHTWKPSDGAFTAVWDGNGVLLPGLLSCWGPVSCPGSIQNRGLMMATSGSTRPLEQSPVGEQEWTWTGRALLGYDTGTLITGAGRSQGPGDSVAWDPGTDRWTRLATAPDYFPDPATVWTGTSLLLWGTSTDHHNKPGPSGIQFGGTAGTARSSTSQPMTTPPAAEVPLVVGLAVPTARTALKKAGFGITLRTVKSVEPAGIVTTQSPAAGVAAPFGSQVTITESSGP